jgi:Holliday junction resolvasome RuvABC endonuclease subunit
MGAKWGREQAGELGGVIKVMLYEHQYIRDNIIIVPPANLKNFVGCKGNAPKEDVKLAVFQQYNVDFKGHKNDEADAYVLAQIARIVGTERVVDLQDFQRKALKKLLGLEDDGPKA